MSKVVILAGLNGRPSMRAVYRKLNGGTFIDTRSAFLVYENNQGFLKQHTRTFIKPDDTLDAVIINWGMPDVTPQNAKKVYNSRQGVSNASNKARARRLMHSAGVRVPKPVDKYNYNSATYPLIWRPDYHHKGKNFVVIESADDLTTAMYMSNYRNYFTRGYLSEFVDKEREFRVHVANGEAIAVSEKPPQTSKKWNEVRGQEFFQIHEWPKDIETQSVKAISALSLDHGGVDVMLKDNKAYVLEVNTAPTLYGCDFEIEAYRKYFQSIIDNEN